MIVLITKPSNSSDPGRPLPRNGGVVDDRRLVEVSKYLARHLRHRPERIGLALDAAGWAVVDELLACAARHRFPITRHELGEVVARNDKVRYELDSGGGRIRARQGHSIPVDLGHPAEAPPEVLFHGTVQPSLGAILERGLSPMGRRHVHLSADVATAEAVGRRRGRPVVLSVAAGAMADAGHPFWRSTNGVWLTAHVPPRFLARLED